MLDRCPQCARAIASGARFCRHCGYRLGDNIRPPAHVSELNLLESPAALAASPFNLHATPGFDRGSRYQLRQVIGFAIAALLAALGLGLYRYL
jgi:hypothetical protein